MSTGFPDRVTQLKARWQNDPSSRIFLQLAEEYRHLGRLREALEVLEAGLREHPGYLSALVAQGRCLLELGEAEEARNVLERVVQQDVTQMVASKLLVRAYLEVGEGDLARQRLDLYGLLNDGDPEIEDLKRRVAAMNREGLPETPVAGGPEEPFPWKAPAASRGGDVFDLDASSFAAPAELPSSPFAAPAPTEPSDAFDPFPDLAPSSGVRSHLDQLASEGIFWFDAPTSVPEPVAAEPEPWPAEPFAEAASESAPEIGPPFEPQAGISMETASEAEALDTPQLASPSRLPPAPEPFAAPTWSASAEPPAPAVAESEPTPAEGPDAAPEIEEPPLTGTTGTTVTLGQLYLRQGHVEEAERIFREVLERDPGHPVAQAELERIARRRQPLEVGRLLSGFEAPAGTPARVGRARKAHLLQSYLQLLKRASRHHVS
jgi:tetratricopeptide (TPR) repeat protein